MKESFYDWMLKFKSDNTPIGDFARDLEQDKHFSRRSKNYKHLRKYLESAGAFESVLKIFEEVYSYYQKDLAN